MGTINTLLPNARFPADSTRGDAPRRSSSILHLLETQHSFQGSKSNAEIVRMLVSSEQFCKKLIPTVKEQMTPVQIAEAKQKAQDWNKRTEVNNPSKITDFRFPAYSATSSVKLPQTARKHRGQAAYEAVLIVDLGFY
jgi:leucyl aminopeptidase